MSILASIPTLLVFIFFQRYFIRGLTLGSVKG
jgi:ABC-type glycerol-3-phosphate transport system permease component